MKHRRSHGMAPCRATTRGVCRATAGVVSRAIAGMVCLAGAVLALAACDNVVDPFSPPGSRPFAVFGYLDTAADTQFVRVARVRHEAEDGDEGAEDDDHSPGGIRDLDPTGAGSGAGSGILDERPRVSTTHLETDERTVWQDSVITLEDGSEGLLYYAPFAALPGATYRIEITDDAAATTRGFTTVPDAEVIQVGTPRPDLFDALEQEIIWRVPGPPSDVTVHYRIRTLPTHTESTVTVPYTDVGAFSTLGWRVEVRLHRDETTVRQRIEAAVGDTVLVLLGVGMAMDVPSIEWMEVDEASNIENGTGFFASVGRFFESWPLDSTDVRALGYRVP